MKRRTTELIDDTSLSEEDLRTLEAMGGKLGEIASELLGERNDSYVRVGGHV
jgi:hypothetical protein